MKKIIAIMAVIAGIALGMLTADAAPKTFTADIQSIRIPKGTTLSLQLIDPISTKTGNVGGEFNSMLVNDQIIDSKVALPAGSIFRGTITKIVKAKLPSRSAVIYINFDHVVSPTGRQVPVSAGLLNYPDITIDGGIYLNGNYGYALQQNWKKTKEITSKAIEWGKGTGDNMQYVCTPLGAIGGVIGGSVYLVGDSIIDLFRKGNDVILPQGTNINVLLLQPIDLPLH